jgi:hypothetical protein
MKKVIVPTVFSGTAFFFILIATSLGCSSPPADVVGGGMGGTAGTPGFQFDASLAGNSGFPGFGADSGPIRDCVNLECRQSTCVHGKCEQQACTGGARTTVSGTIYDPAGKVPLYNIAVYIPNADLAPIADGPSCDPCDPATGTSLLSGSPLTFTKTDNAGKFKLGADVDRGDVPSGSNVPMVIQVGKWRRQVTLPNVTPCQDNPITDVNLLRLPRSQDEGHIPRMAITTGELDALECLLRKVGIADSEFTPESGSGRVNLYAGGGGAKAYDASVNGGAAYTPIHPSGGGADWWDSVDNLKQYDIILHACEGSQGSFSGTQQPASKKSQQAREALQAYADLGGRVFASHWHVYWFEQGTTLFKSIAKFTHRDGLANPYTAAIDSARTALTDWMMNVGGSTTRGQVVLKQNANQTTVDSVAGGNISQRWIYAADRTPQMVIYLQANTPVPANASAASGQCGKVVMSDLHVSSGSTGSDQPAKPFPTGCVTTELSPQEKVLEFMLFDIASCVAPIIPIL